MNEKQKGLKTSTIWLMVGTALIFDAFQILFSWAGIGWLLIPIEYGVFAIWFWMHGLSFFTLKRAKWLGVGALAELSTAGLFPAFTGVVINAALSVKIKETEAKVVGEIGPKSGDNTDINKAA